jgi:hypothetical protein
MAAFDPASDPCVVRLRDLPVEETLWVFVNLVERDPERADVAALALREQGRAGRLLPEHVGALTSALAVAPNPLCIGHLAKAVAALGRAAAEAAPILVDHVASMRVTDDVEYWSFDGCIWALGYLGGPAVAPCLAKLEAEKPSRAVRSQSIYRGVMPKEARQKQFLSAIEGARALLAQADPGTWRTRKITGPIRRATAQGKEAQKSWNLRAG